MTGTLTHSGLDIDDFDALYPGGEPLPESVPHERVRHDTATVLRQHFSTRGDVFVASNLNVYYRGGDVAAVVEPDVLVIAGVAAAQLRKVESYRTFQHGGAPLFVLEVLEDESLLEEMAHLREEEFLREDLDYKRAAYTAIGVAEYWQVDPTGGDRCDEVLQGERLRDGRWVPIAMSVGDAGTWRGYSESLDLDIVWDDELLFYQHRRDEPLPNLARSLAALRAEETARRAAEAEAAAQAAEVARLTELLRRQGSSEAGRPQDPPG